MLRLLAAAAATATATVALPAALMAQPIPDAAPDPLPNTTSQPVATPTIDVNRIVVAGFPQYDADGIEGLSPTEFAGWVAQLFANARMGVPEGDYLGLAFAQTDVSKDGVVQLNEFAQFLRGG